MRDFKFYVRFFSFFRRQSYSPCCFCSSLFESSEAPFCCWSSEAKCLFPRNGNLPSGPGRNPLPGFACRGFNAVSLFGVFSNANRAYKCAVIHSIRRFAHIARIRGTVVSGSALGHPNETIDIAGRHLRPRAIGVKALFLMAAVFHISAAKAPRRCGHRALRAPSSRENPPPRACACHRSLFPRSN